MPLKFIPDDLVLAIHADLLQRYGGKSGIRDITLLESALAQPKITFGGTYVHKSLFDKAAAYGFHICKNHPFIDGNKRVSFILMDIFLQKNGWEITATEEEAFSIMMLLAEGKVTKDKLSQWLKEHSAKLARR